MTLLAFDRCYYCRSEPYREWIETPNNGPLVPCPICNNKSKLELEYDLALAQRAALSKATGGAS